MQGAVQEAYGLTIVAMVIALLAPNSHLDGIFCWMSKAVAWLSGVISEWAGANGDGLVEGGAHSDNPWQSYRWLAPHSCSWDHPLELWYQAYMSWPPDARTSCRRSSPLGGYMQILLWHFDHRIQLTNIAMNTSNSLAIMQKVTAYYVDHIWKVNRTKEGFCSPLEVIGRALQVSHSPHDPERRKDAHSLQGWTLLPHVGIQSFLHLIPYQV